MGTRIKGGGSQLHLCHSTKNSLLEVSGLLLNQPHSILDAARVTHYPSHNPYPHTLTYPSYVERCCCTHPCEYSPLVDSVLNPLRCEPALPVQQTLALFGTLELAMGGFVWSQYRSRYSPLPSFNRLKPVETYEVRLILYRA